MNRTAHLALAIILTSLLPSATEAAAGTFSNRGEVRQFVAEMADRHGFDPNSLDALFKQATPRPKILKAMTAQRDSPPPWTRYRAGFVDDWRVSNGVRFWEENAATLARARQIYGVPEEIIIAIIGVESRYGSYRAPYPVFDALATLAFGYPRRAEFFRGELEQYLLLAREEHLNPTRPKGSFAGAMGLPQFMPSSYRNYAVDFDGDGRRDLLSSPADAIGSVANYLRAYGWRSGQPTIARARVSAATPPNLADGGIKPDRTLGQLESLGVTPVRPLPAELDAVLLEVDDGDGPEYWLGFNNFYVVTRYNRSLFYALAVCQLSREIRAAHDRANQEPGTAAAVTPLAGR